MPEPLQDGYPVPMTPSASSDGAPGRWRSPRPRSSSGSRCRRSDRGSAGMASRRRHGLMASTGATRSMRSARCVPCATRSRADTPPARPSRSSAPARPRVSGAASTWIASRRAPRCSIRTASEGRSTWRRRSSGWNAPSSRWRFPACARWATCGDRDAATSPTSIWRRRRSEWFARLGALTPPPYRPRPLVLACAPTELHTIGLEAIAVMLGRRGWACNVLGAMTPPGSLLATLTATRGAGAIVTAQRSIGRRGAIEALRAAGQMPGVRLFYGGNAFATVRAREGVPGLYLGTDLRAAVEIVGRRSAERRRHLRHRDRGRGWRASWPRRDLPASGPRARRGDPHAGRGRRRGARRHRVDLTGAGVSASERRPILAVDAAQDIGDLAERGTQPRR